LTLKARFGWDYRMVKIS